MAFSLFPKLPAEIQIIIWRCVDPDPNIITVTEANTTEIEEIGGHVKHITRYQANPRYTVPAILHACYMSRRIGLETYSPRFEKHFGQAIYFDTSKDIIRMESCAALASFVQAPFFEDSPIDMSDANKIRFLAITGEWISYQDRLLQRLHRFDGLEEVYFERTCSDRANLVTHFEWGLRMKWQTWKAWTGLGMRSSAKIPRIEFLPREDFRKLTEDQAT